MAIADLGKNPPHSTDTYKSKVLSDCRSSKRLGQAARMVAGAHLGNPSSDISEKYRSLMTLPPKSGSERELIKSNAINEKALVTIQQTLAETAAGNTSATRLSMLVIFITICALVLPYLQNRPIPTERPPLVTQISTVPTIVGPTIYGIIGVQ